MPLDQQQQQQQDAAANTNGSSNNNSPDTLGENSSPASLTTQANHSSQHSFGFDTPSLAYSNNNNNQQQNPAVNEPPSSEDTANNNNSLGGGGWQDVAAAHMAKVALQQSQTSQDCTLLTSHVQQPKKQATTPTAAAAAVCVKESPPLFLPSNEGTTCECSNQGMVAVMRWYVVVLPDFFLKSISGWHTLSHFCLFLLHHGRGRDPASPRTNASRSCL